MTRPVHAAAMTVAALVVLFSALGRADLFNPDEPREAEIAREMWVSGDLVVPRLNGEPFLEKPPLFYWLVVGAYRLGGGPAETPARAVPALAGLLCVVLTWGFGRRLVGDRAALLGALALLTSFQFLWTARRCTIDMPLTLTVLVACCALQRGLEAPGRARVGWLGLGYLAVGASVMLKGLVGAGLPALAVGGLIVARRDWGCLRRCAILPGMIVALLPAALWVALLHARIGPSGVREFFWVNNVLRFTGGASKGHVQPFWYYLPTFFTDFAPWSLLAPFAIASACVALRHRYHTGGSSATGQEGFLLSWLFVPLVVLSIASTKRGIYLLPLYPAAALLVGVWLARLPAAPTTERAAWHVRVALGLLLAATVVVAVLLPVALRLVRPEARGAALLSLGCPILAGLVGSASLRSGRAVPLALLAAGTVGLVEIGLALLVVPRIVNGYVSPRAAAVLVRRMGDAGDRLALYRFKEGSLGGYLFYSGRTLPHLHEPPELRRHLLTGAIAGEAPRSLALMREEVYEGVAPSLGIPTTIVRRFESAPPPGPLRPGAAPIQPESFSPDRGDAIVLVAAEPASRNGAEAPRGESRGVPSSGTF